jgi:2-polyprenyl-6-methoxyphenol hydroxylase-like FAD-dependent oxidoreductase
MKELSRAYHGPWDEIRETLTDPSRVNYTWFETHVLDAPWHRGRVVLIGDAAHTCPPTIAQGGAMALEDAVVLAELLLRREALDRELWNAFTARRYQRAKTVVDASNQLAQWQLDHVQGDIPSLMRSIAVLTSQPA